MSGGNLQSRKQQQHSRYSEATRENTLQGNLILEHDFSTLRKIYSGFNLVKVDLQFLQPDMWEGIRISKD